MTLEETVAICEMLGDKFDSHEYICKYLYQFPVSYGMLLIKHENVRNANAEIALFLTNHSSELHIRKIGETKSTDMLGNMTSCAAWEKF